jgi:hypothetical protein
MIKKMNMNNSSQLTMKEQENPGARGTTSYPQSKSAALFTFYGKVPAGSIALLTSNYSENMIVDDDGSSNRTEAISRQAGVKEIEDSFL